MRFPDDYSRLLYSSDLLLICNQHGSPRKNKVQKLTIREKLQNLIYYKKKTGTGKRVTQAAMARWEKEKLKIQVVHSLSTISRIVKDSRRLEDISLSKKRPLKCRDLRLRRAFHQRICTQKIKGIMLFIQHDRKALLDGANK